MKYKALITSKHKFRLLPLLLLLLKIYSSIKIGALLKIFIKASEYDINVANFVSLNPNFLVNALKIASNLL